LRNGSMLSPIGTSLPRAESVSHSLRRGVIMSLYRTAAMTTASDPDGKTSSWGYHTDLDNSAGWSGGPSTAQNWRRGGGSAERGDDQRQSQSEHGDARQHIHEVRRTGADAKEQQHAAGGDERTRRHQQAWTDPGCQPASLRRQEQHDERHRQKRAARQDRGKAGNHLQVYYQKEEQSTKCPVHHEGNDVGGRELAVTKDSRRKHRISAVSFVDD